MVCGNNCASRVCIRCDATVTARNVYKRYYQDTLMFDKITGEEIKEQKSRDSMERWKKYYCFVGGLSKEDLQYYWKNFSFEINRLGDSFFYMCNVLHFDSAKGLFSNNCDYYGDLKRFNKKRRMIL